MNILICSVNRTFTKFFFWKTPLNWCQETYFCSQEVIWREENDAYVQFFSNQFTKSINLNTSCSHYCIYHYLILKHATWTKADSNTYSDICPGLLTTWMKLLLEFIWGTLIMVIHITCVYPLFLLEVSFVRKQTSEWKSQ